MDVNALNRALIELAATRAELKSLDYSNPRYDELEEQLHDQEDTFQDEYGRELEQVLQSVHDKYCPDNDVLLPIAYLGDGVPVESDLYPGKETRLILEGNPPQIILQLAKDRREVVWNGQG